MSLSLVSIRVREMWLVLVKRGSLREDQEMHTLVNHARVQLDRHGSADDLAEETGRVAGVVCCWGSGGVGGGAVGSWGGHFVFGNVMLCLFCGGEEILFRLLLN